MRGARQGVHGERECAQGDGGRDQALGDVALAEHFGGERVHREHHHEQRNTAIGEQGTDQHDDQHRLSGAEQADGGGNDRPGETGQFDQLAEHCAQQEHREVEFDEAHHFLHEHPGERGGHGRGIGEQDGAEGGDGGKEDYAVTAIGSQHQQGQSGEGDEHGHRGGSPG